ncbi:hypothetical protein B0H17DRAFT_1141390 [Mycena rosella]|uniref:Uncharacterized protein n=1 Tax=Mycena rosella TaxID=1033263 RepID=A0AAD7CZN5_MYCRO|nr:hypothetical protein B0H17DRAFT_1141390 [Mycena rosella]
MRNICWCSLLHLVGALSRRGQETPGPTKIGIQPGPTRSAVQSKSYQNARITMLLASRSTGTKSSSKTPKRRTTRIKLPPEAHSVMQPLSVPFTRDCTVLPILADTNHPQDIRQGCVHPRELAADHWALESHPAEVSAILEEWIKGLDVSVRDIEVVTRGTESKYLRRPAPGFRG